MNAPQIRMLDARLAQISKEHIERFHKATPAPKWPSRAAVIKEIEAHDFQSIGISAIADAFFNDDPIIVSEAVETPLMARHRIAEMEREQLFQRFEKFVRSIRTKFRDRILFGNEAADLLITDFESFDCEKGFCEQGAKRS